MDDGTGLHLDAATLLFSISVLAAFMAAVTFGMARGVRGLGLGEWGKAMLCGAGAFLLFYGHRSTGGPWLLTFLLANALLCGTAAYCLLACARLLALRPPARVMACCTALGLSGAVAVPFLETSRWLAMFTLSLALALEFGYAAVLVRRHAPRQLRKSAGMVSATMGLLAGAFAVRATLALFEEVPALTPVARTTSELAVLLLGALFFVMATTAFMVMVNERHRHESINRLRRDGLTGLYTRTAFGEMEEELNHVASPDDYAVVMLDIDHFKSINDRVGHAGGDAVLAHAARLIAGSIRGSDIAVRYGGEEFCVLLKNCSESEAAHFAQRLVKEASQQQVRLRDGRQLGFTFSAGYAARSAAAHPGAPAEPLEEVIQRADEALYRAKNSGRNQAVPARAMPFARALAT